MVPAIAGPNGTALGLFMIMWGIFTGVLFIGTLKLSRALQVVFGSLTILFFLLAAGFMTGNKGVNYTQIAGYEGIFCGASAIYTGFALLLNEVYGTTCLPLGPMKK